MLARKRRGEAALSLLAAACYAGMLVLFAVGNNPINARIARWTLSTLPDTWRGARDAWEAFHVGSAALALVALVALLVAGVRRGGSEGATAPPGR